VSQVPDLNTFASAEEPGLKWVPKSTVMDMSYDKSFTDAYVGDAYERMFLNAALVMLRFDERTLAHHVHALRMHREEGACVASNSLNGVVPFVAGRPKSVCLGGRARGDVADLHATGTRAPRSQPHA
jgi:hypothetical protein